MQPWFGRHPVHLSSHLRYNQPVIVLVTVCTRERQPLLANPAAMSALSAAWQRATAWQVGSYVVMPDHIHLFCSPVQEVETTVQAWVGYWKRFAGYGAPALARVFQKECWDTQMRSAEHYGRKLDYVRNNPVRKGLATVWPDWPYQGTLHPFDWIL